MVRHTCSWELETSDESTSSVAEKCFNVFIPFRAASACHRVCVRGAALQTVDLREPPAADELAAGGATLAPVLEVAKPVGVGAGAAAAGEEQERYGASRVHLHLAFAWVGGAHCSKVAGP